MNMRVLFVSAEMKPFAKTGGLGDVVSDLPRFLRARGIDARVLMPLHGPIKTRFGGQLHEAFRFSFTRAPGVADIVIHTTEHDGVPVYFLESWPFFGAGDAVYTDINWDRKRFVFFSQAALATAWQLREGWHNGESWFPDVLHVHDWHTALIPFLVHEAHFDGVGWEHVATVLTIHNMGYQGWEAGGELAHAAVPTRYDPMLGRLGKSDNLLGIGIAYAQKLNTVSPRHALELYYPRFGEGLEGAIQARDADFVGILNGLDTERVNPVSDPNIPHPYNAATFRTVRPKNKAALQAALGLAQNPDTPLLGIVSRLVDQKGMDFAVPALRHLLHHNDIQLVVLGAGEPEIEDAMRALEWDYGDKAKSVIDFRPELASLIYAGCDLILVPSRYEPCGLTQLSAMRYGALPVVRDTGGLADTVENYDDGPADRGTGFVFLFEESDPFRYTLEWAITTYHNRRDAFERMQARAMRLECSWEGPVQQYIDLYRGALGMIGR